MRLSRADRSRVADSFAKYSFSVALGVTTMLWFSLPMLGVVVLLAIRAWLSTDEGKARVIDMVD